MNIVCRSGWCWPLYCSFSDMRFSITTVKVRAIQKSFQYFQLAKYTLSGPWLFSHLLAIGGQKFVANYYQVTFPCSLVRERQKVFPKYLTFLPKHCTATNQRSQISVLLLSWWSSRSDNYEYWPEHYVPYHGSQGVYLRTGKLP
jgi:hypothetical protein